MSIAIELQQVNKYYTLYEKSHHRLFEVITGRPFHKTVKALEPISLQIPTGQVVGLVGNNGAGKSTLLKLITKTASLTSGSMQINGRVVALLELGAGFHPELSGKENIFLYASILGIKKEKIKSQYQDIVDFSGLKDFIDNPVKTYSSGMFVRLAFSVATCVDPDILIIDEALSVGDGGFAQKSFQRIMEFKEKGKTIIFCSHSMYQINAICDRAIWLDKGRVILDDVPAKVVPAYNANMQAENTQQQVEHSPENKVEGVVVEKIEGNADSEDASLAYFVALDVFLDGEKTQFFQVKSCETSIAIQARFHSNLSIGVPNFGVTIENEQNYTICSAASSLIDFAIARSDQGDSTCTIEFPKIALLNGHYTISAYLICDKGIHLYEQVDKIASIEVRQKGRDLGVVHLDFKCK